MRIQLEDDTVLPANGLESTLNEIGRRMIDREKIEEIENPRAIAIQLLAVAYIRAHKGDFEEADDGGYIYVGDE